MINLRNCMPIYDENNNGPLSGRVWSVTPLIYDEVQSSRRRVAKVNSVCNKVEHTIVVPPSVSLDLNETENFLYEKVLEIEKSEDFQLLLEQYHDKNRSQLKIQDVNKRAERLLKKRKDFESNLSVKDSSFDPINPNYYISKSGLELSHVFDDFGLTDFKRCNVIKYVLRAGRKPGQDELKDLEKAKNYLKMAIAKLKKERRNNK